MNLQLIKNLCIMKTETLKKVLIKFLKMNGYNHIYAQNDFIIAEGNLPICLIAHMDTVFARTPEEDSFFYDNKKKILWNPDGSGFDDRAGIYIIISLLQEGYKPSIIFTDKEEVGGIGAKALITRYPHCPFKDCRALIQLDRANKNDCVFYGCDNKHFERYISRFGFEYSIGTFSDISIIAPAWEIAATNLSVGYEDEHSYCERLNCKWCDSTLNKVKKILDQSFSMENFIYIPCQVYNKYLFNTGPSEDEIELPFDIEHSCIICNKKLNDNEGILVEGEYKVCQECFDKYYMNK